MQTKEQEQPSVLSRLLRVVKFEGIPIGVVFITAWATNIVYKTPWMLAIAFFVLGTYLFCLGVLDDPSKSRKRLLEAIKSKWKSLRNTDIKSAASSLWRRFWRIKTVYLLVVVLLFVAGVALVAVPKQIQSFIIRRFDGTSIIWNDPFSKHVAEHREWIRVPIEGVELSRRDDISYELGVSERNLQGFFQGTSQRMVFLLGPAGAAKTPIARQLTYESYESGTFDVAFYIDLEKYETQITSWSSEEGGLTIPQLLVAEFSDQSGLGHISDSPSYYVDLCNIENTLIVLDSLDELVALRDGQELSTASIDAVIAAANEFRNATSATIVIATRPEGFFLSDSVVRGNVPPHEILRIQPINKNSKASLINRAAEIGPALGFRNSELNQQNAMKASQLVDESSSLAEFSSQLDYLNMIALDAESFDEVTEFRRVELLVSERVNRNRKTHWQNIDSGKELERIEKICFLALTNADQESFNAEVASTLFGSGFCEFESSRSNFSMSPTIIRDFFAVKHLLAKTEMETDTSDLTPGILSALERFPTIREQIGERYKPEFANRLDFELSDILALRSLYEASEVQAIIEKSEIGKTRLIELLSK